jgi:hypothetical protein
MTKDDSNLAANAICHAASMVQESWQQAAYEVCRPCVLFKPKLSKDGNQWCALFGDNLQEGVSGFGNTPADAMYDFDRNWSKP